MTVLYRYRFGSAVFDEAKLELIVAGLVVEVQPRPLQILALLLARGGEVVTREEFFEQVWLGRPTVENVLPNAVTKLRNALGEGGSGWIENVPRVGYRFAGSFERSVVGRRFESSLALRPGQAVPFREGFALDRMLGQSRGHEVWLARHRSAAEQRVYKFASDAEHVAGLKREATLGRVLRDQLGERADLVRIIDWNFDTAPLFLESEFGGEDLAVWATTDDRLRHTSPAERLGLFLQIADAVAAAHGVAVLHKDLKPGNVLLARSDDRWQARLVDFGSGRLLEPERLAQLGITSLSMTVATGVGSDATRGTLMYLAPELFQDQPATVRSDVYALGVLLYQLLVGDLRRPFVPGWERDIDDALLRDDIARATDADPARRTASVSELASRLRDLDMRRAELARVHAEQTRAEQDREALRRVHARRPWLVATVVSLGVGLLASLWLYERVRVGQRALAGQVAVSEALNRFLTRELIAMANPAVAGRKDVTVIEAASLAAPRIDVVFASTGPDVRSALHAAMQQTLAGLSDYSGSIAEGRKALAALNGQHAPDPRREAEIRLTLASQLAEISKLGDATSELDAVDALLTQAGLTSSDLGARLWYGRGLVAGERQALAEALEAYGKAWTVARQLPTLDADVEERIQLSDGDAHKMAGHFDIAEAQFRDLLAKQRTRYGPEHVRPCYTSVALANLLGYMRRFDEAMPMIKTASACLEAKLGPTNNRTLTAYEILASLYFQQDRYAEAAESYADVGRRYAGLMGSQSLRAINARLNAAMARQYAGDAGRAEHELAPVLETARTAFAEQAPLVQNLRYHLADCRLDQHRTDGVATLLEGLSSQTLSQAQVAPDWEGRLAYQRGRLALELGDRTRAVPYLETAASVIAEKNPDGRISEALVRQLIARAQGPRLTAAR